MKKLKGKDVTLSVDGNVLAKSTSCSLNVSANTIDASSKDDADPLFENPEFVNTSWNANNESFVADAENAKDLIRRWMAGERILVSLVFGDAQCMAYEGYAYLTSVSITAAVGDKSKLSVSFTGDGVLEKQGASDGGNDNDMNGE